MTLAFPGRVEALHTIPTGGAAVSATNSGGGPTTCTVAAGDYFLTAAGGVSSLITALKNALDDNAQGYPQTSAATLAAIGYGTSWAGGWLCNESSGSLAPAFGSPSLTAISTPTYGTAGPRGGVDFAVGLDSSGDGFTGGNVHDVGGTDDLIIAWVGKFTSTPANFTAVFSKGTGADGWIVYHNAGVLNFTGSTSAAGTIALPTDWHVGIATIDRGAGKMRIGVASLVTGVQTIGALANTQASYTSAASFVVGGGGGWLASGASPFLIAGLYVAKGSGVAAGLSSNMTTALANFVAAINASWTVSLDTSGGTGRVSIGWTGYTTPTWSLSWTDTDLRDALGFTANISSVTAAQTGTESAEGVWFPNSPMNLDDEPRTAPLMSDACQTQSPTGNVVTLVSNTSYKHTNVRWEAVPIERYREASATYPNQSLEAFWATTQLGQGNSYFTPGSALQLYYNEAGTPVAVGSDENISGWYVVGVGAVKDIAKKRDQNWTGLWTVTLPTIVSEG